ncbi:hypothetical protein BGZ61DRAFT_524615 [Ilyonectria robusta]|uniref:uncharacterized protein n=1 Tax=Ilyonectria robusta TaxID=1079257 RepID=UPI001E8E39A8|nr:uncharacterized protein BGZ61DRAFT_524615 [Ilyonectria robusta]KAH8650730.1 hypothetical protein BGZ61DRAFT_524615 [Ilyonectria robusta]
MESPTVLALWLCSCLALAIMGTRLIWRKIAGQPFNLGDYLTMVAAVLCLGRLSTIYVVLIWGNSNVPPEIRESHVFTSEEIYQRTVGGKLTLAGRCFYNSFLWVQKMVLLDIYRRLLLGLRYERHIMIFFITLISVTWVVVIIVIFVECHPVHLYWQVIPDPGTCTKAQLELFVLACFNIVTDAMLLGFPFLLFTTLKTTWKLKVRLYSLFLLGLFIIVVTIVRLPINRTNKNSQANRSMWASTELFVATLVVNAPTIYGLWNKKRQHTLHSRSPGSGVAGHSLERGMASRTANTTQAFAMASMSHKQDSFGGIMRTKEVIVSEYVEHKEYVKRPAIQLDEVEVASNSSQRGILRD